MLAPDTRLRERYRILHKIGGGGFGYVYKAVDEVFGCSVAIKETREQVASVDKLQKAFEREAKLLRNLKHDCLPRVTDYFFQDNAQFLVMDFIEGEDLGALLGKRTERQGPFAVAEVLPWADKILSALEYLHSRPEPIIHRDIKPSNIKLADDGGIYLLDFGLAKGATGQMSTMLQGQSSFSVAAFTHEYAPLEQLQDTGTQPQSDIYSLGATLYHLLTGQSPISASKRDEAIQRQQGDPLRLAHEVNPAIPLAISQIISQAMIIRWWDRLGSAKEMRTALKRATGDIVDRMNIEDSLRHASRLAQIEQNRTPALPLQDQGSLSKKSVRTVPTQSMVRPSRFRRIWMVSGISIVALAAVAVTVRSIVPQWFNAGVSTNRTTTEKSSSPVVKSPSLTTASTMRLSNSLPGHNGIVWSVAFSRDGTLAASGGDDGTVILWDTKTWTSKSLSGHQGSVYAVSFSPDGKILASGGADKKLRLWNVRTGELESSLEGQSKSILELAFSPNDSGGNVLASVTGEAEKGGDEIRLWYSQAGWRSRLLSFQSKKDTKQKNGIFAIAFSPDGSTLATAGYGKAISLWSLNGEVQARDIYVDQKVDAFVGRLGFSADGKLLAVGNSAGEITVWRTEHWEPKKLGTQENMITALTFSPDNITLAGASKDEPISLWHIPTMSSSKLPMAPTGISQTQWSLAFSPDGQTLLSGGNDKVVNVWQGSQSQR